MTRSRLIFTSKERDAETGLDNFGARYFSAAQGRFTSPDPIHFLPQKLLDPQQWNMYAYVRNNPLSLFDPNGLYTVDCPDGDSACTKASTRFEDARLKDLNSKTQSTREAAAAWGSPTDKNGITVTFKDQATMNRTYGNGPGDVNGAVTPGQTADHQPDIQAAFSESLRGGDLQRTITHEGAHIEDDMAFLHSFDAATGTFNGGLNITHYDTEFHAFEIGAQVKAYQNFSCGGTACGAIRPGPTGYQALDLYLRTNPTYVRSNNSLVFPSTTYPQRPAVAPQQ